MVFQFAKRMKRALSPEKLEADGRIIEQLLDAGHKDAIVSFLSNLEPPELYVLAKIPQLGKLRAFLNKPGVFKSLYDKRSEFNGPEKDVANFVASMRMPIRSYWKLWLASWASLYQSEIHSRIELFNGLIRVDINTDLWFEEDPEYLCEVSVSIDPAKFSKERLNRFYSVANGGLRWYPKVLKAIDYIHQIVSNLNKIIVREHKDDWTQRGPLDGYYSVYSVQFGSNKGTGSFFADGALVPKVEGLDSKTIDRLSKFTQTDLYELAFGGAKVLHGVSMYDAENFVLGWGNYVKACLFYLLLQQDPTAFLLVDTEQFGVEYLRSCVVCEQMANFHGSKSFCGVECFNSSISGRGLPCSFSESCSL